MGAIDLNRGAQLYMHPDGYRVAMYVDDPGVFYDAGGNPVSEDVATAAGFDVQKLLEERKRKQHLAKAEADFDAKQAEILNPINVATPFDETPEETPEPEELETSRTTSEEAIRNTKNGDPRETASREMSYNPKTGVYRVADKSTDEILFEGEREESEEFLLDGPNP